MLPIAKERGPEQRHNDSVQESQRPTSVRFGDDGERATRFKYPEDLSDVGRQVGPVVVRLYCRDNVECTIREW